MNDEEKEAQRRTSDRVPLQAMVTYRLDGEEYGNLAADVSPNGIFIRTFMPPAVGTRLDLTVRMPRELGGYRVELEGQVMRRVDDQDPRHNGMGVKFTAIHATEDAAIRYLVTHIFGCVLDPDAPEMDFAEEENQVCPEPMDDEDTSPGFDEED